jgi:hypothetical protein
VHKIPTESTHADSQLLEIFIIGVHCSVSLTGGHSLRPSEGSHVDDVGGVEVFGGIGATVAQHETTLGIGVVDLHGFACMQSSQKQTNSFVFIHQ